MGRKRKNRDMKESTQTKREDPFKQGREVFFHAFTKQDPETLFVCRGEITKTPDGEKNRSYRVRINAVSDKSVTGQVAEQQKSLIGRAITKRRSELTLRLGSIFQPKTWLS